MRTSFGWEGNCVEHTLFTDKRVGEIPDNACHTSALLHVIRLPHRECPLRLPFYLLQVKVTRSVDCLLSFEQHVLHSLLPALSDHDYNLRPRPHNLSLSCTMDHRNFIPRLAFKTPINTQGPPLPLRNNCFPVHLLSLLLDAKFTSYMMINKNKK